MRRRGITFIAIAAAMGLAVWSAGCGGGEDETSSPTPEETPTAIPDHATPTPTEAPSATPTPGPVATPTPEPLATPTPEAEVTPTPEVGVTPEPGQDLDNDGHSGTDDCDDTNPTIYNGAVEVPYDGIDQDCDGQDLVDVDTDGHVAVEAGGDDCDDNNSAVRPGVSEMCDGLDNNCDGTVDEGFEMTTYYVDADGDGHGVDSDTVDACDAPDGYAETNDDCDDSMWSIYPGASEICNGLDDDCDGRVDTADTLDDSSALSDLNTDCGTYETVVGGEIGLFLSEYTVNGEPTTDSFPNTLFAGGHKTGEAIPDDWPSGCIYLEQSYFIGVWEGEIQARAVKICFDKGQDGEADDKVYAEMTIQKTVAGQELNLTMGGILENGGMDTVRFAEDESDERYQVWYVNASYSSSGDLPGNMSYESTITLQDARFVIDMTPGT